MFPLIFIYPFKKASFAYNFPKHTFSKSSSIIKNVASAVSLPSLIVP